jgi:aryl-alcohol dehydrogenase-like predicted oxidoreductase
MKYGTLPNIALPVSRLVFGTDWLRPKKMFLFPDRRRRASMFSLLSRAWESGINCFDCARVYYSEAIVGEWMRENNNRKSLVLISKGGHPNLLTRQSRLTPKEISADVHSSLRSLKTDTLDVFLLHYDDPEISVGPLMERLNEHVRLGDIRTLGVSNWTVERIEQANQYCSERGLEPFRVASPHLSLFEWNTPPWPNAVSISGRAGAVGRQWFKSHGMPVICWSVLGRGYLQLQDNPNGFFNLKRKHLERVYDSQVNRARRELIQRFSTSHGVSKTAVAVAGVLGQDLDAFAVIGPKTPEQLEQYLQSLSLVLSEKEFHQLLEPLNCFPGSATGE